MTVTDPRVSRTRKALQNALLELFGDKPFQSITVAELTRIADVNRATFYRHYTDKIDLLEDLARETFFEMVVQVLEEDEYTSLDELKALVVATCNFLHEVLGACSPLNKPYEPIIEAQIQQQLVDYVEHWLDNLPDAELRTEQATAATVISWAVLGPCLTWARNPPQPADVVAEQVYDMVINGLWTVKPAAKA